MADAMGSMSAHRFCGSGAGMQIQMPILGVCDQAGFSQGYACAMHIEPSCCPVLDGDPQSWMVLGTGREDSLGTGASTDQKTVRKRMEFRTAADPDKTCLLMSTSLLCCAVNFQEERSTCFLGVLSKPRKGPLTHA